MRNVFDQYSQAENRLTHALFSALDQDRKMLGEFLRDVCKVQTRLSLNRAGFAGGSKP